jgi:ribonuclease HII
MAQAIITASLEHEMALYESGYRHIAGLDEAGRGAWAGPVAAAAVILPLDRADLAEALAGVTDSKRLTPDRRKELVPIIKAVAIDWGVGRATSREIDEQGIITATKLAMERALRKLDKDADYLLIDALNLPETVAPLDQQQKIIKGDQRSLSIAAASILAKVNRDSFMEALDEQYPEYGFAGHKGYGTKGHRARLTSHGPCRAHRYTFKPIMTWQQLL